MRGSRLVAPLAALIMGASLVGCSSSGGDGSGASTSPTDTTTSSSSGASSPSDSAGPFPAASTVQPVTASLSVTDPEGVSISLSKAPQRVICLTGWCDDALVELGMTPIATETPKLLAMPEFLGANASSVPLVKGSFGDEDVEAMAKQTPDLVIGLKGVHDQLAPAIKKFSTLWLVDPTSWKSSVAYLRTLAQLADKSSQEATAEQDFYERGNAAVAKAEQGGLSGQTALVMYGGSSVGVNTSTDLLGQLMALIFNYPWPTKSGSAEAAQTYSVEEILSKDPHYIYITSFVFSSSDKTVTQQYANNAVWKQVTAVKSGHTFEVSPDLWASGRGPRSLALVLEQAVDKALG